MSELCECRYYATDEKDFLEGKVKHHKNCPHLIEAYECTFENTIIISEKDLNNIDKEFIKDFGLKVGNKVRITQKEYDELREVE